MPLGEEAHIVSGKPTGPRYRPLEREHLDRYENRILVCPSCHTIIDRLAEDYSESALLDAKRVHETWVRATLEADLSHSGRGVDGDRHERAIIAANELIESANDALFEFSTMRTRLDLSWNKGKIAQERLAEVSRIRSATVKAYNDLRASRPGPAVIEAADALLDACVAYVEGIASTSYDLDSASSEIAKAVGRLRKAIEI